MIKNNVFMKHFKRVLSVTLAVVVMITLSGCSGSADKNPTGGLTTSDVYAKSGNYTLTVGELYNELRYNSLGYLNQEIEEATFYDYLPKVDLTDTNQKERMAEYILTDIYSTFEEDEIDNLTDAERKIAIEKYIDTMYLEGYEIEYSWLKDATTTEKIMGSSAWAILEDEYKIDVAKYLYAFDCLLEEIEEANQEAEDDEDLDPYFSDSKIASYYDSNYKYEEDINAVIIRFINQDEATNVLRKFGIKTYNGEWFLIQPPKDDQGNTDFTKWSNESDYNKYYNDYTINQSGANSADTTIKAASNSDTAILKIFVEMYNYIYTYRTTLTYDGRDDLTVSSSTPNFRYYYDLTTAIINSENQLSDSDKEDSYDTLESQLSKNNDLSFDKDRLDTYSTSLTSYVHDTLRTTAEIDEDTGKELSFTQYTASSRSYNNNYYLIFKLSDAVEREFYTIEEDEDGNSYYDFKLDEFQNIYDEILDELFNESLTSSYISAKASEKAEYISVEIYDSALDFLYSQSNTDYSGTKGTSVNLLAKITYKDDNKNKEEFEVTVVAAYEFLEKIYGAQTSVSLLFNKYIVDTDYYKDLDNDDDYQSYKESINYTLTLFANDSYSSYGYSASIGKYTFMQAYYRTAVIDEAIKYLMLQDAKREFFLEQTTNDDFYAEMEYYSDLAYTNYYSLSLTNILVYVDMDEDGVADKKWFATNDEGSESIGKNEFTLTSEEKKQLAYDLINDIIEYAKFSTSSLATSFSEVVTEFNSSSRIVPSYNADGSLEDDKLSGNVETIWAKYRRHGLYISTGSLEEFSNTTIKDETMQALVKDLYESPEYEIMFDNSFSSSYLITEEENFVITDDGVNLLLVTSGNGKSEIDFEDEDEDLYMGVPIRIGDTYKTFDVQSTGIQANSTQIEVYCREYFTNGSSTSLPTGASSYLSVYLDPVLTKYNSEVVQLMIMSTTLDVTFTKTELNDSLTNYTLYLQRVSDGYTDTTDESSNFYNFWESKLFGGAN